MPKLIYSDNNKHNERDYCISPVPLQEYYSLGGLKFLLIRRLCTQSFSRMLVVYASRAQLDHCQASASVQKGVKEESKEQAGDHVSPITDVRAAVRKAKQFARACRSLWGNACVRAYVRTRRYGVHDVLAGEGNSRAL